MNAYEKEIADLKAQIAILRRINEPLDQKILFCCTKSQKAFIEQFAVDNFGWANMSAGVRAVIELARTNY